MTAGSFLTLSQAAEQLQVSTQTMRRYVQAGKVPALKLGKDWRIPARALWDMAESVSRGAVEVTTAPNAPPAEDTPIKTKAPGKVRSKAK